MRKKFHYQNEYLAKNLEPGISTLSFFDKQILLDGNPVKGVIKINIKKSSNELSELKLNLLVKIKGLDGH